ncbi:hypothetical protein [Fructilactobacillus carniphilus]|uniref:LXG domain-containing protein n=1 Tax=Fructilactobacillus carniphilus TaxID=2940297 RepID=A0ABY5BWE6_9LACO|nr:hypothetical protein [Fructilactobacillus carniphilus]USS90293.1 hypothetical protein M3M37_05470 [Fructilactobacillus carniphilus]
MGLKYDSGESQQMISSLQVTIGLTSAFIQTAESGIYQLIASVGKDGMTGEAYESGKNLFNGQIKGEVRKLKSATDKLKKDLSTYEAANQRVSHYGRIDEDQLESTRSQIKKQISNLKRMQRDYQHKSSKADDVGLSMIYRSHASHIQWQIDGQNEGLHAIEKELADLRSYNQRVSGLFKSGIEATKHVQSSINSSGGKTSSSLIKELEKLMEDGQKFTDQDNFIRLQQLLKLYPKGIIKAVLDSKELTNFANTYISSSHKIKLMRLLVKYRKLGDKTFLKVLSINKIGSAVKCVDYFTSPFKSFTAKGLKMIPKVKGIIGKGGGAATWAELVITFASSAVGEFQKTKSIGKASIGGALDTVKSVGPLEGAAVGASVGGAIGSVVPIFGTGVGVLAGTVFGGIFGASNSINNFIHPHFYSGLKKTAYSDYDKIKKTAYSDYDKIKKTAYSDYDKIKKTAYSDYDKIKKTAYSDYDKIKKTAYSDYDKIKKTAYSDYDKIKKTTYSNYDKVKKVDYSNYDKIKSVGKAKTLFNNKSKFKFTCFSPIF